VRPSDGQGAGAVRVAGRATQGADVAGRVGWHGTRRRRPVRAVLAHDVLGHIAQMRPAGSAVHAVAAVLSVIADAYRPAPVQTSVGRVPEAQGVRPVPV